MNNRVSRRQLLKNAAAAAGAYGLGGCAALSQSTPPSASRQSTTYVLVHGTHSSATAWAWLARGLVRLGHRAYAVDLPGHGLEAFIPPSYQAPQDLQALATEPSPLAGITLDDYANHVIGVITELKQASDTRIVLVGHSQGGVTIGKVGNAVPELLAHIAYVAAFCCVELPSAADYLYQTPEGRSSLIPQLPYLGNPETLGVARVNWRSADPKDFLAQKAMLAAHYTDAEFRVMLNTFQLDEPLVIAASDARVEADTWGEVPRTYIRFNYDKTIPPELQDRMIGEADRVTAQPFNVHALGSDHYLPASPELLTILGSLAQS